MTNGGAVPGGDEAAVGDAPTRTASAATVASAEG